jgi:membrane-associated phospholipid phosphatase
MKPPSFLQRESPWAEYVVRQMLPGLLAVTALVAASACFLDTAIASFIDACLRADALAPVVAGIPDLLFYFVAAITASSWAGYFWLARQGVHDRRARFLKLCGTVAPLAFLLKTVLQYLFGRSTPQLWVVYHQVPRFHWLRAGEGYGCFPSGHMTVFGALAAVLWRHFPRYRPATAALLLLLGIALVVTNYHFLSDTIAGAYLGVVTCAFAARITGESENRH